MQTQSTPEESFNATGAAATPVAVAPPSDPGAAFATKGHEAAVFKPRFGQAHQQYLSPRWLCEAAYEIALHAFGLDHDEEELDYTTLHAIDPTCGSGRLLAPFQAGGHHVLGIELDERLVTVARRALGKDRVRPGDVMAYGPVIPTGSWHVAVLNPPYGLWWPVAEGSPYQDYELASEYHIESQHMVLELATHLLAYNNGLLIAILSGTFFDHNPRAREFLGKHYQVAAHVTLPRPFQAEYGIDVDAAFVVAVKDSPYRLKAAGNTAKKLAPLTGPFEATGDPKTALVQAVNAAYDRLKRNPHYRAWDTQDRNNRPVCHLRPAWRGGGAPDVPALDMALDVDTTARPLRLTARGVTAQSDGAAAWLRFYNALPLQAYDAAQGCLTPLGEAYGSLPNVLMTCAERGRSSGVAESCDRLTSLGFDVALTAHDAAQIERRARRYARDRLPIRELEPMEYLAWFEDGPLTAQNEASLPNGTTIPAGATYELRSRWIRRDEQVGGAEEKGKGKKRYVQRTYVDRGYLVLHFYPQDEALQGFTVEETDAGAVQALVDAFGLPEVPTVDDLPAVAGWTARLQRFMDAHEAAAGGKRLYAAQAVDAVRMACKSSVALLYEMGAGKTATIAHWAVLRGYRDVVLVTPASVAPGIIEDLTHWGFPARRLSWGLIANLRARKRRHRLARQRVKTARQRAPRLRQRLARLLRLENGAMVEKAADWGLPAGAEPTLRDLDALVEEKTARLEARLAREEAVLDAEDRRLRLEAALARKRRHRRCLVDIRRKGKARDPDGIEAEIAAAARAVDDLTRRLAGVYAELGDVYRDPCKAIPDGSTELAEVFYVTSYEDLSLGDHLGLFDPWDHDHYTRDGDYTGTTRGIRGAKCPTCHRPRKRVVTACPQCGTRWRGQGKGGGRVCRACGHRAWTMGTAPKRLLPEAGDGTSARAKALRRQRIEVRREHRLAAGEEQAFESTYHQWPLGDRIKRLFSCAILDEGQEAKSKLSLRGAASRGLKAKGKALLTGTWMKGFVTDLFWTAGWLLGFGSPLWPFPYRGGSGRFLEQFGTFRFYTREFADTLEVGRRKPIPSVSNLNRLWKLLSPVSIRRLKEDFLSDLPAKHRHVHWLPPDSKHDLLVGHVNGAMREVFERELRKQDPNMGVISAALWWGRYVASCPNEYGALHFAGAWGHRLNVAEATPAERRAVLDDLRDRGAYLPAKRGLPVAFGFNKVAKALELVEAIRAAGEKAIVFTSLRGLYRTLEAVFQVQGIAYVGMDGVATRRRNGVVRRFEASDATVLLAGTGTLNRGVTVNGANHVLILNLEWSPETTLQAEDRCHRPGQTREVHVHYLLGAHTIDEQMYDLVNQKWAAQRAVQDREAQFKSVEEILEAAALANAKLAVARAALEAGFRAKGASDEAAAAQAQAVVDDMEASLVFGRVSPDAYQVRLRRRRSHNKAPVVHVQDLDEGETPDGGAVQLAMFDPEEGTSGRAVQLAFA